MSGEGGSWPPISDMAWGKEIVNGSEYSSRPAQVLQSGQQFEQTSRELVLHSAVQATDEVDEDEDVLEFDLEDEADRGEDKFLAMARFYSGKKFNATGLFEEMRVAWGLNSIKLVKILGDNRFMLEFDSPEARRRVVEGGPWRHRGDALLVVEYDGFSPPSAIGMWAHFYDLPGVLRKEDHVSKAWS
jgi:hypothetical protein